MSEIISNSESSIKISKKVTDYISKKHQTIVNDYKTPDGRYSEHCGLVALEVANLLIKDGYEPYIMKIGAIVKENGFVCSKKLTPKIYEGRVSWGAHQVCSCGGLAFDPILDKPVSMKNYTKEVFGENIKTEILFSTKEIKEIINKQL
jgi:hypothetical protein